MLKLLHQVRCCGCLLLFFFCIFFCWPLLVFADEGLQEANGNTPVLKYEIRASYGHDPLAFTQGLSFQDGFLYEGTGLYGSSTLRRSRISGESQEVKFLPDQFFGEGVTVFGDQVIQLTWKSRRGILWDKKNMNVIGSFSYPTEGWGLTHDGVSLIMSNGSDRLFFLDPQNFKLLKVLTVSDQGKSINFLNELEFIKGEIWANIWKQKRIVKVDPQTGAVTGWVELAESVFEAAPAGGENVLNGIAYDKENDRIFVTGKRWNKLYEIRAAQEDIGNGR